MELEEALRHARGIAGECHVNSRLWDRAEMAVPHYLWTLGTRKDRRRWCSACKRWMRLKPERMTPSYAAFDPYMEKFDGDEEPFLPVLYSGLQEHLFRERYAPIGKFENAAAPGMPELCRRLKEQGYVLAVASSKPEEMYCHCVS